MFWIHNTGPIGCLPYSVIYYPAKHGNMDQTGCVKSYNEIAMEFNRLLKERVSHLREKLSEAELTYVDLYSAKYALISGAQEHGKFHFFLFLSFFSFFFFLFYFFCKRLEEDFSF